MKRGIITLSLILVVLLVGGTCAVASAPSGHVVWWTNDIASHSVLSDKYIETNPNVTVELVPVENSDYMRKWLTAYATGTDLPDVGMLEQWMYSRLANIDGAWENLAAEPYNLNPDDVLDIGRTLSFNDKGEFIAFNEATTTAGIAYRRDMAQKYLGVSDPEQVGEKLKTWEDYYALGKKIYEESGGTEYLFTSMEDFYIIIFNQNQTPIVDKQGNINEDVIREYIEKMLFAKENHLVDLQVTGSWTPTWNATFSDGQHMVFPCPPWAIRYCIKPNDENGEGNWGLIDGPDSVFTWGGTGYSVSSASQSKQATFELLKYIFFSVEGCTNYFDLMDGEIIPYRPFIEKVDLLSKPDPFFAGQDVGKTVAHWLSLGGQMRPLTKYDETANYAIGLMRNTLITEDLSADELFDIIMEELTINVPLVE